MKKKSLQRTRSANRYTQDLIVRCHALRYEGRSYDQIAEETGVNKHFLKDVLNGRHWGSVLRAFQKARPEKRRGATARREARAAVKVPKQVLRADAPVEGEVWKVVSEYPAYEVSSVGRVCRGQDASAAPRYYPEGALLAQIEKGGYLRVRLYQAGKKRSRGVAVHRLVLGAFVGPRSPKIHVHHIDEDPKNNKIENLRYCTAKEHSHLHKRVGRKLGQGSAYTQDQIIQVHVLRHRGLRGREIEERTGVKESSVWSALRGKAWPHVKEMFDKLVEKKNV